MRLLFFCILMSSILHSVSFFDCNVFCFPYFVYGCVGGAACLFTNPVGVLGKQGLVVSALEVSFLMIWAALWSRARSPAVARPPGHSSSWYSQESYQADLPPHGQAIRLNIGGA
jgi:hypothetical protein